MFGTGGAIVHIKCAPLPLHCFFDGSVVSQSFIHAPSNQYFLCVGHDRSTSKVEGNVGKCLVFGAFNDCVQQWTSGYTFILVLF